MKMNWLVSRRKSGISNLVSLIHSNLDVTEAIHLASPLSISDGKSTDCKRVKLYFFLPSGGSKFYCKKFSKKMCYVMAYNMSHIQETVISVRHVIINRSQHSRSKLIEISDHVSNWNFSAFWMDRKCTFSVLNILSHEKFLSNPFLLKFLTLLLLHYFQRNREILKWLHHQLFLNSWEKKKRYGIPFETTTFGIIVIKLRRPCLNF